MSVFPRFTQLELSDKKLINQVISRFDPYSDFNFTSMYCWNVDNSAGISMLNDNLIVKIPDYLTGETIYSIIGDNRIDESFEQLSTLTHLLKLVPQPVIDCLKFPERYKINEERDHFDYIYSLDDLIDTSGKKYKNLRNKINQSNQLHSDYSLRTLDSLSDENREEFHQIFLEWARDERNQLSDVMIESRAIDKFIDQTMNHNLVCMEVRVNGRSVGFSVNEILPGGDYAVCHIQKTIHTYKNIDTILTQYSSKVLRDRGCRYVNWEQDLGLSGLRQLKESYRPVKYFKKYTVTLL